MTVRIGMLTPSSNTVLEPVTQAMLSGVEGVSAHFARFKVVEIALSDAALMQFELEPMLAAAEQLADAKVDVIVWNGTSAGWLGLERDTSLCEAIAERTGIPASSAVLALNDALAHLGAKTFGLVTPYTDDVQARIIETYAREGLRCTGERHLGISENFAFGTVDEARIEALCRAVAAEGPDAIAVFCTNLRGGPVAPKVEEETGVPVLDTVATALWGALRTVGRDPASVRGWGRLFELGR